MMESFFPYVAVSGPITVRVSVSYLADQSLPSMGRWFWSYHIRLENHGDVAAQLISRHWLITDGNGALSEVEGEGVVGEQPVLMPGSSYDYVSGCPLSTTEGSMEGSYLMVLADGTEMLAAIPHFLLTAPATTP
jgi:ApaG protein